MTAIAPQSQSPPSSTGYSQQNGFSNSEESSAESMDTNGQEHGEGNSASSQPIGSPPAHSNGVTKNKMNGALSPKASSVVLSKSMSSDDEDDNIPWAERLKTAQASGGKTAGVEVKKSKKVTVTEEPIKTEIKEEVDSATPSKRKASSSHEKKKKKHQDDSEEESDYDPEDDYVPTKKKSKALESASKSSKQDLKIKIKVKKESSPEAPSSSKSVTVKKTKKEVKEELDSSASPTKRKKKVVEEEEVWRWWEEEKKADGVKWKTLEHKGPLFAPPYVPMPSKVKFIYDGKEMTLSEPAEEVASFYAKMLEHEYTSKQVFNHNFFKDWRKVMTPQEREKITDLTKCNFKKMHAYFQEETEKRKAMTKEEKQKIKEEKEKEVKEYGFAYIDGHKQKIGNFRIEPPGLFRGRGDHPKMGRLKKRIRPEDVVINCSKGSKIPEPPRGHKWKEVRHDNTVTWLCGWSENVLGSNKYIMLNPSSKIKGEKDWEKFETARKLKGCVDEIRQQYNIDLKAREMRIRQRAVALYFIDKLALRAGNEKDTDEAADTVGCCSLRCEHIKLHEELDKEKYVVEFDFLGKDSIRYYNKVPVEKQVYKNLKIFVEAKEGGDDLFDRLDTSGLNAHLRSLMPGLTAKVFRTYNASITLQDQLVKLTKAKDTIHEKMLSYNRANRQVAILCNHQRAVPKTHEKSMENLENKIKDKKKELKQAKEELQKARGKDKEKLEKKVERVKEQLQKLKTQRTDKDENKQIALGTSKLNYLDPRISVAWCKKNNVPVEKVFNKTQREKFRWALDMATEDYVF
ncbi:eukaryotic DNA topoisomerase i, catalytic core domain-containing protein [Ditylenchus destructor]|uniref:DNA topoisomerase I n=1 Tax=Ditylenchus destructor TaxID=166010 RepID=A0AAD4N5G3_9BILA|nr:eukaryotic DNA topoisomerase i, catalytic core domain-containing protein [Ditylenchus destructor]